MSAEGEADVWMIEFCHYCIWSCLISNNDSRCLDITRIYLLFAVCQQTEVRESDGSLDFPITMQTTATFMYQELLLKLKYFNLLCIKILDVEAKNHPLMQGLLWIILFTPWSFAKLLMFRGHSHFASKTSQKTFSFFRKCLVSKQPWATLTVEIK